MCYTVDAAEYKAIYLENAELWLFQACVLPEQLLLLFPSPSRVMEKPSL
jgi:hypothetical protein